MEASELYIVIGDCEDDTPLSTLDLIKDGADVNLKGENNEGYLHQIARVYKSSIDASKLIPVVFQLR